MKIYMEDIPLPQSCVCKFMAKWDGIMDEQDEDEFALEIHYPPIKYSREGIIKPIGEIYWEEMSYRKYGDTSLTWNYNFYADGNW